MVIASINFYTLHGGSPYSTWCIVVAPIHFYTLHGDSPYSTPSMLIAPVLHPAWW